MSDTTVDPEFAFDPMDQSKTKDFDLLRRLREERPVVRPAEHVVYTARYNDTAAVFKNAKRFSSVGDMRAPGVTVPEEESFLGEIDAPLHPRIRRILLRGFTPERAIVAEPWTRNTVRQRLATIGERGHGDLMDELGIPLPVEVAAHVLGIPDELHESMHIWCNELLHSTWPAMGKTERGEGIEGAFPEFAATIDAAHRRASSAARRRARRSAGGHGADRSGRRLAHPRATRAHARHQRDGRSTVDELHDRQLVVSLSHRRGFVRDRRSAATAR